MIFPLQVLTSDPAKADGSCVVSFILDAYHSLKRSHIDMAFVNFCLCWYMTPMERISVQMVPMHSMKDAKGL
jgi:hypothetical protein